MRRPRPDFVPRCWPDGKLAWRSSDDFGGFPECSGEAAVVAEGLKSFPSGACVWGRCFRGLSSAGSLEEGFKAARRFGAAEGLESFPSCGGSNWLLHAAAGARSLVCPRSSNNPLPLPIGTPPGHSSWSASGMGFLSWVLLDLLRPFDGGGHVWRLVAGCLPLAGAAAVGVTRCG